MGFKIPKIKIPDLSNVSIPELPDVNLPDIPSLESVDLDSKLNTAKNFIKTNFPDLESELSSFKDIMPDTNGLIPDINSMMPDINTNMASFDVNSLTQGLSIPSPNINDLGIDLSSMESMGVDISEFNSQIDTNQLQTELTGIDMNGYMSPDMDITSQLEMPDMSPKGILAMMTGTEDPTDIKGIISNKFSIDNSPDTTKTILTMVGKSYIRSKAPLLYSLSRDVMSHTDTSSLDFSSIESIKNNDYLSFAKNTVKDYTNRKVETAKTIYNEAKEFKSYVKMDNLNFDSFDSIKSNDYIGTLKSATKDYGNAKLDQIEQNFSMDDLMGDMNLGELDIDTSSLMSEMDVDTSLQIPEMDIDTSEFESLGIDTSMFNTSSINFDYDMPKFDTTSFEFDNPMKEINTDSIGFDVTNLTQPLRDMLNKYL